MGNWTLTNGIISRTASDGYVATSQDLFSKPSEEFKCEPLDVSTIGLRLSKIGLPVSLEFDIVDKGISLNLYAIKSSTLHQVPFCNDHFCDYIIINNAVHYLTGHYENINNTILNIGIASPIIDLPSYMKIKRDCINNSIPFIDNVGDTVSAIKDNVSDFTPKGLVAKLFPYQESGCNWLSFMTLNKCGCILGDEMGLGKTLQVIALFGAMKEANNESRFLVVCPLSLLENWKREIAKFYPSMSVNIHHGTNRSGDYRYLLDYDVNIISYSNAQSDLAMLNMIKWSIVVIDEAQSIKNPAAKRTKCIKQIRRDMAVAVTGTPFENHMTDIWSIVDFILPDYLGSLSSFNSNFNDSVESAITLEKFISPLMIRRKVKDVAKDLPERIDIPQPIQMTQEEASYYEAERVRDGDLSELKSMKLDKIQKLRMFCTHPLVYDKSLSLIDPCAISNKYSRLCEILEEIFELKEKAIIFTSFNEMINLLFKDIANRFGVYTNFINGSIDAAKRQCIIDEFSNIKRPGVLILNPKAAGAGLNITAANHVIHYNLEWNPAIEDQASARSYRRGQAKTVFIHRLFYANTIEEIINDKIQTKRSISDTAIIGNTGNLMTTEDLIKALQISPYNN